MNDVRWQDVPTALLKNIKNYLPSDDMNDNHKLICNVKRFAEILIELQVETNTRVDVSDEVVLIWVAWSKSSICFFQT